MMRPAADGTRPVPALRGPPSTPAPLPPSNASPRPSPRVTPTPSPRGGSPPTSPRMAGRVSPRESADVAISSPRGPSGHRSPPVPQRASPPASPRDTMGRSTPATAQRIRDAADSSSDRLPQWTRPARTANDISVVLPTAPPPSADLSSSLLEDSRLSFADSTEFISEDFTGERDLKQLMQPKSPSSLPAVDADAPPTPPRTPPALKKSSPASVRWKSVRPSASVLAALKLVLTCDAESFNLHANQPGGDVDDDSGDAREARMRSETRPEMMSALRELEDQIFEGIEGDNLQQSMAVAIEEHMRESGTSGDVASQRAQLELLRARVSTIREQRNSAVKTRYSRRAFAPLPPSADDTEWM